jgi:hypothetical protein
MVSDEEQPAPDTSELITNLWAAINALTRRVIVLEARDLAHLTTPFPIYQNPPVYPPMYPPVYSPPTPTTGTPPGQIPYTLNNYPDPAGGGPPEYAPRPFPPMPIRAVGDGTVAPVTLFGSGSDITNQGV